MSSRVKKQPEGTIEYEVGQHDTLPKIALQFDVLPTELTRLNKLPSNVMLFPGQTLFVPVKKEESSEKTSKQAAVITDPPNPLLKNKIADHRHKVNGDNVNHDVDKIKLTKSVSLNLPDMEEDAVEHYFKLTAKYITDGQGVVNGVMLVTPHSVMFNPDVSDPLVMDRGRDVYCISAPLSAITGAALYNDIAAMAVHEPLKAGRFHVDADTAESLSRQNSSSMDMSPTSSPTKRKSSKTLDEVHEKEGNSHNDTCTDTALNPPDADTENIEEVVKDLLEDVIEQVTEQTQRGNNVQCPQLLDCPVEESSNERSENTRMISPASEDSGISSPINRPGKTNDVDSTSVAQQDCHNEPLSKETCDGSSITNGQLCDGSKADLSHDSVLDSGVSNEVDRPRAPSLLASLSNEVKYWFGGKEKRRASHESWSGDDLDLIPRPASAVGCQLRFLCVRISRKHWCSSGDTEAKQLAKTGEDLFNRDRRRREYWFAIPLDRIDQVYSFFQQWCPNLHRGSEEDSMEECEDPPNTSVEGEGISFNEGFFSSSPPKHKVIRTMSDSQVLHGEEVPGPSRPRLATDQCAPRKESLSTLMDDAFFEMDVVSDIMTELHVRLLSARLPSRTIGHSWELVYSTFKHGFSLKTLYRRMEDYESPALLVVLDVQHKVFGVLASSPLQLSDGFYGTGESFLFTFDTEGGIQTFVWTGENTFFQKGSLDSVAFGGGGGHFGLWLDADLYHGTSHRCETYQNATLSSTQDFLCSGVEVWSFV